MMSMTVHQLSVFIENKSVTLVRLLREAGVAVSLCEVFAVGLDDRPGQAAGLIASNGLKCIGEKDLSRLL